MNAAVTFHLNEARNLYEVYGAQLLMKPRIRLLLDRYDAAILKTQKAMHASLVVQACGHCAGKTGSCCFQEVETWYDSTLILINFLLAADIPTSRTFPDQCIFLGKNGCLLRARYAFCLNYFCPELKINLGPALMKTTLAAVGYELSVGWDLEKAIYGFFAEEK